MQQCVAVFPYDPFTLYSSFLSTTLSPKHSLSSPYIHFSLIHILLYLIVFVFISALCLCRLVHSNLFSFSSFCFSAFLSFFFPFLFAFHDADTSRTVPLFSCPRREGTFYLIHHQQQQQHIGRCMRVNT